MKMRRVLEALVVEGESKIAELAARCGVSKSHLYRVLMQLKAQGLVEYGDGLAKIADVQLLHLLRVLRAKYDLGLLVRALPLLECAYDGCTPAEAAKKLKLSASGLRLRLSKLKGMGLLAEDVGRLRLTDPLVSKFVEVLRLRKAAISVEPCAEVLYVGSFTIKRVPKGRPAAGALTAFSFFEELSVRVVSEWDYYVQPAREISLEEAIVHALRALSLARPRVG